MRGASWADARAGYPTWIDVGSWIDYALIEEFARNIDAYRLSAYMVKQPAPWGGRFKMGPVWDFDRAFGNTGGYAGDKVEGWSWEGGRDPANRVENPPPFWLRLLKDPGFRGLMGCRWQEVRKGPLSAAAIKARIDAWVPFVATALKRDLAAWSHPGDSTAKLRTWMDARGKWLDTNLPCTKP
jgi:hypothetical protein